MSDAAHSIFAHRYGLDATGRARSRSAVSTGRPSVAQRSGPLAAASLFSAEASSEGVRVQTPALPMTISPSGAPLANDVDHTLATAEVSDRDTLFWLNRLALRCAASTSVQVSVAAGSGRLVSWIFSRT